MADDDDWDDFLTAIGAPSPEKPSAAPQTTANAPADANFISVEEAQAADEGVASSGAAEASVDPFADLSIVSAAPLAAGQHTDPFEQRPARTAEEETLAAPADALGVEQQDVSLLAASLVNEGRRAHGPPEQGFARAGGPRPGQQPYSTIEQDVQRANSEGAGAGGGPSEHAAQQALSESPHGLSPSRDGVSDFADASAAAQPAEEQGDTQDEVQGDVLQPMHHSHASSVESLDVEGMLAEITAVQRSGSLPEVVPAGALPIQREFGGDAVEDDAAASDRTHAVALRSGEGAMHETRAAEADVDCRPSLSLQDSAALADALAAAEQAEPAPDEEHAPSLDMHAMLTEPERGSDAACAVRAAPDEVPERPTTPPAPPAVSSGELRRASSESQQAAAAAGAAARQGSGAAAAAGALQRLTGPVSLAAMGIDASQAPDPPPSASMTPFVRIMRRVLGACM